MGKQKSKQRKMLQEDDEDIIESEGFDDDDEMDEVMVGGPAASRAQNVVGKVIGYSSFDDEDHEGESKQAVHSLPVNNGGLLKQATRVGLVRKPTSLSKR